MKTLDQGGNAFAVANKVATGITPVAAVAMGFLDRNGEQAAHALDGILIKPIAATAVAAAGSTTADAAQLASASILVVSSDSAAKGVKLPTGVAGAEVKILNTTATACKIYPATGGTLNGGAANAALNIPASLGVRCICTAADTWTVFNNSAKAT